MVYHSDHMCYSVKQSNKEDTAHAETIKQIKTVKYIDPLYFCGIHSKILDSWTIHKHTHHH